MAGSHDQGDPQRRLDWDTPFKARMNELRARLRSVEVAVTRLSPARWEQVVELMMAIWSHTKPTGDTQTATSRIMQTSGLTRRQYYTALAAAKKIGLVAAMVTYKGTERQSDRLRVNQSAIDAIVAHSRRLRLSATRAGTSGEQRELAGTSGEQRELAPAFFTRNPRAPAGAAKEFPNNSSTSTTRARRLRKTIAVVEEEVSGIGVRCRKLAEAVRNAVRVGKCRRRELVERVAWFGQRLSHYAPEHQGGVLYHGLFDARRDMPVHQGWPYSENFLEQEARREREREKRRLQVAEERARERNRAQDFERAREREQKFGPVLNGLSDDDLRSLETECFRDADAANFARGRPAYRLILLAALANRAEKGTVP